MAHILMYEGELVPKSVVSQKPCVKASDVTRWG